MEIAALIVSLVGVLIAGGALLVSLRSVRNAKRSADAAEDSAGSARRSADAAERGVCLQEQSYEFDRERHTEEQQREAERRAPRFEPKTDHAPGAFNLHGHDPRLNAHLRNAGGSTAKIETAELQHFGGMTRGRLMLGDISGPQEPVDKLVVEPGGHVIVSFEDSAIDALRQSSDRPVLHLTYTGAGDFRQRLEMKLGRLPADPSRRLQWRVLDAQIWPA